MERFRKFCGLIISCFLIFACFFTNAKHTDAISNNIENSNEKEIKRSLESLQDLDYQTWQLIVYPKMSDSKKSILRIVGYPGSLRMDHPTSLVVKSGRKKWDLEDITRKNKAQAEILNDSTAEFDLSPVILELDKNRPLRMTLPGLINDLPIPPYLVGEWRTLTEKND